MSKHPLAIIVGIIALVVVYNSFFIVDQRQQSLIVQLGEVVRAESEPGLHAKIPFIQSVITYDKRILDINMQPQEVIAFDRKRLIVDAFAKYKIVDALKYYKSVRTDRGLVRKFSPVLESSLREEVGRVKLSALLSSKREEVMLDIKENANRVSENYGIDIIDVRIMRADLPNENSQAIYERMKAQHEKEARQTRAEGAEESLKIKANADKDRRVLLATAKKTSEIIRGKGEAQSTKIYADAFNRDPEFYKFYRTMQAYRASIKDSDTRMVLSPDSEFLNFFGDINGRSGRSR